MYVCVCMYIIYIYIYIYIQTLSFKGLVSLIFLKKSLMFSKAAFILNIF